MFSVARSLITHSDAPVMLFDMGALGTKIYIAERGIIRASHIINKGSFEISQNISKSLNMEFAEAEKIKRNIRSLKVEDQKIVSDIVNLTLDFIWSEMRSIIADFERKTGKHINQIILSGGGVALPNFLEIVEKELNVKAVMGNPFEKVSTPSYISSTLRDTAFGFSVATGAALRKLEEL